MARETVLIGCRLPNGITLRLKQEGKSEETRVVLKGNSGEKLDSGIYLPPKAFSTTEVDAEFWAAWKALYVGFPPLKNRAIFEARNEQEAAAKAKDVEKEKTGFEQIPQTIMDGGIKLEKAVA